MRQLALAVALLLLSKPCLAQDSPALQPVPGIPNERNGEAAAPPDVDTITFDFQQETLAVPHWRFEIRADGRGRYLEQVAATAGSGSTEEWKPITISAPTLEILRSGIGKIDPAKGCETKTRNIAQTGKKTLTYGQGAGATTCAFNHSDDERVMRVATLFRAIAEGLQFGPRLARLHRFDRLGLDAEMEHLVDAVKEGRAAEIQNIAPVLQSIVDDDRVIDRVRRKAARLLQDAAAPAAASAR